MIESLCDKMSCLRCGNLVWHSFWISLSQRRNICARKAVYGVNAVGRWAGVGYLVARRSRKCKCVESL